MTGFFFNSRPADSRTLHGNSANCLRHPHSTSLGVARASGRSISAFSDFAALQFNTNYILANILRRYNCANVFNPAVCSPSCCINRVRRSALRKLTSCAKYVYSCHCSTYAGFSIYGFGPRPGHGFERRQGQKSQSDNPTQKATFAIGPAVYK